ncbi:hypothetical protein [Sphingomonas sp. Leaf226]|uniref:hypothetical protein n=1 Tax=Sphingomonas sp. Leaf226 TaxID=1735691 RepID=UPI0006F240C2|nr:hypothetical protein [Sphingomonas sp. Leaf226]KQM92763.1 hypothetical protein ASE77_08715 [Sphingomonas sp. Leaf226]
MSDDDGTPGLGQVLARGLETRFGMDVKQVAVLIEAAESEVLGVFTGARAIRPEIALKLEKVFGVNAMKVMTMQAERHLIQTELEPDVIWKLARLKPASESK